MTTHDSVPSRPDRRPIPLEEVARIPAPGMAPPSALAFSPDDRLVTYLLSPGGDLNQQLYAYDPATGEQTPLVVPPGGGTSEENLTLEEKLRRERERQLALGVTRYAWAEGWNRLLVPLPDGLYVQDGVGAPLRRVVGAENGPLLDPQLSPDGQWVAYVQDAELYIAPAEGGQPRQLTHGARGTGRTHGLAEFIAQEEMDRHHGYWWSCDSCWLAFTEVDDRHIPVYHIMHQGKDALGEGAQEDHRYPFAGQPNAVVRLAVVGIEGGDPVWLELGGDPDAYLARVDWMPDGSLVTQLENRAQTALDLVRFDPRRRARTLLFRETSDVWINLHDMFWPLKGEAYGSFLWASERTGFRHLYLYDRNGSPLRQLSSGDWMVDALIAVDEDAGAAYFTANREGPAQRQLYRVPLAGGEAIRITQGAGTHSVTIDHAFRRYVDLYQSLSQPPVATLRALPGAETLATLFDRRDPRIDALGLEPPQLVTLQNRAGTLLYGAVYRPDSGYGSGPYPTIVYVYGGPHVQLVADAWNLSAAMRPQYLRRLGFLVFVLDNRGSARRGLAFEGAIKGDMGHLEVEDQVDGVRYLVEQGLADPARVGIYGWSYGGYMAAMCLARAPETFKVAVAGAPVTALDGYDTHYTERYMGTPESNPRGYADSSVIAHVDGIAGSLMLVHGLIDENVHFRHTARLINALVRARKPYELLLFPDERHSPRRLEDRVYMEERIRDYFLERL